MYTSNSKSKMHKNDNQRKHWDHYVMNGCSFLFYIEKVTRVQKVITSINFNVDKLLLKLANKKVIIVSKIVKILTKIEFSERRGYQISTTSQKL